MPIRGTALNGGGGAGSSHSIPTCIPTICVKDGDEAANSCLAKGKDHAKQLVQSVPHQEDEAKMGPSEDGRLPRLTKEGFDDGLSTQVQRTAVSLDSEGLSQGIAFPPVRFEVSSNSETSNSEEDEIRSRQRHQSEGEDNQMQSEGTSPPGCGTEPPEAIEAEIHPETKMKPTVGFADPPFTSPPVSESISPAVSPDESPVASTRPRTLSFISENSKYAGLLGSGYRPGSTSSSSDLLESPLFAAKRRLLNQSRWHIHTTLRIHSNSPSREH